MGICFSSDGSDIISSSTAKVITLDGALIHYSVPVTVFQVIGRADDSESKSHPPSSSSCFVCDSDSLAYDTHIQAMGLGEWLQLDHIYFVLPQPMLHYPLSAPEMAALAVKASSAFDHHSASAGRKRDRRRGIQVMPMSEEHGDDEIDNSETYSAALREDIQISPEYGFLDRPKQLLRSGSRSTYTTKRIQGRRRVRIRDGARLSTIVEVDE